MSPYSWLSIRSFFEISCLTVTLIEPIMIEDNYALIYTCVSIIPLPVPEWGGTCISSIGGTFPSSSSTGGASPGADTGFEKGGGQDSR